MSYGDTSAVKKKTFDEYAQTATQAPAKRERRQFRPGKAERPTVTIRLDQAHWERLRKTAIDERMTVQDIVVAALENEFKKRGWRWD
jgi:hypothetical protein